MLCQQEDDGDMRHDCGSGSIKSLQHNRHSSRKQHLFCGCGIHYSSIQANRSGCDTQCMPSSPYVDGCSAPSLLQFATIKSAELG